jgi:steroid delta-isomerase-like uncharacterized protein
MDNKELVRVFHERAFVQHDLDAAAELVSENYCVHDPAMPGFEGGREAFKKMCGEGMEGMRDFSVTINDQIAEGDRVATRWTMSGCQTKDFPGIPNKGECFKIGGITISKVTDGKIVEEWTDWDDQGFARQLGSA